jgi:hypothetical protein
MAMCANGLAREGLAERWAADQNEGEGERQSVGPRSIPRQPDYHVAHHCRTKGCRKNAFSKIGAPTRDGKIQKAI